MRGQSTCQVLLNTETDPRSTNADLSVIGGSPALRGQLRFGHRTTDFLF